MTDSDIELLSCPVVTRRPIITYEVSEGSEKALRRSALFGASTQFWDLVVTSCSLTEMLRENGRRNAWPASCFSEHLSTKFGV